MTDNSIIHSEEPIVTLSEESDGKLILLGGRWTLRTLAASPDSRRSIKKLGAAKDKQWDISHINQLDSAAAYLLWQAWGQKLPEDLIMCTEHRRLFDYWQGRSISVSQPTLLDFSNTFRVWLTLLQDFYRHLHAWVHLSRQLVLDFVYLLRHPHAAVYKEISQTIYKSGVNALGITALVGFLVGVSISYLSSLQLQQFGAEIYIIDLLGLSIIRELGPMLTAILIAGRSGSAMTAEIGIMRVTQELDALSALGVSHSMRLVLPKVIALSLALPLLIVWTDTLALVGGMVSAQMTLDIGYKQFLDQLP